MDNSAAKAYLCNQGGTLSIFLYQLAFCILNLDDKHGITLIPAYIAIHLNMEAIYYEDDRFQTGIFFLA